MKRKKLPKSFTSWILKRMRDEGEADKIDVEAHYDNKLTVSENKTQFENKFGIFFKTKQEKISKKEQQKIEREQIFENKNKEFSERFGIELNFA